MTISSYGKPPIGGKWSAAPVRKTPLPFAALPLGALRDPRLIPTDVLLLGILLGYARASSTCWPAVATLMADIRKSRRTVQLSLARLKAAGWLAERPAENPTGRVIVLAWREGAQAPASTGRKATPTPGAQPKPPEWKMQREIEVASPGSGQKPGPPPSPRVMTPAETRAHYEAAGWLDRPESDPLRRLAERRLVAALGGSGGLVEPVAAGTSFRRPKRPGGLVGPRQSFAV